MNDHEPDPEDGPDYHADHMAWATRNTSRAIADRIGLEVERDAALAEVVRLRGIIAEALVEVKCYGEDPEPEDGWRIVAYTSGILEKAAPSVG